MKSSLQVALTHLVGTAIRGHPAFYSGGTALRNVIPRRFLNTEMTCTTQSNHIKQCSDILINKAEILLSGSFRTASHSVTTDRTHPTSPG